MMIDLYEYYINNVKEDEYCYRFYKQITNVNKTYNVFSGYIETNNYEFKLFDVTEIIVKFRNLCQPQCPIDSNENKCWFYLICYYLNKNGYYIDQFPNILRRPPEEPSSFSEGEIKTYLISKGIHQNGTVTYASRRVLVSELDFKKSYDSLEIDIDINEMFQRISTRNASFQEMSEDEKLKEILNLIEHMLKKDGKYIEIQYDNVSFDYISDDLIIKYKKQTQCFRHASEDAIKERLMFTDIQKEFLIDLGIVIIKTIYHSLNETSK